MSRKMGICTLCLKLEELEKCGLCKTCLESLGEGVPPEFDDADDVDDECLDFDGEELHIGGPFER